MGGIFHDGSAEGPMAVAIRLAEEQRRKNALPAAPRPAPDLTDAVLSAVARAERKRTGRTRAGSFLMQQPVDTTILGGRK